MRRLIAKLMDDRRGTSALEYGLIVSLIVIAMFPAFLAVARQTTAMWNNVNNAVTSH
jgi:pilus assembly protein Flp/PilA